MTVHTSDAAPWQIRVWSAPSVRHDAQAPDRVGLPKNGCFSCRGDAAGPQGWRKPSTTLIAGTDRTELSCPAGRVRGMLWRWRWSQERSGPGKGQTEVHGTRNRSLGRQTRETFCKEDKCGRKSTRLSDWRQWTSLSRYSLIFVFLFFYVKCTTSAC